MNPKPWIKRVTANSAVRHTIALGLLLLFGGCQNLRSLPDGLSFRGEPVASHDVRFFADTTWIDENGQRHVQQTIFDEVFRIIAGANELILVDMFLYNDFQGPVPETTRALASELTDALIAKKVSRPEMQILVISDPINVLYGGLPSAYFERLEDAGIPVVITDLRQLHDSNTVYSFFWRLMVKPFGNTKANTLANPIGPGRVSIRSFLELINFKANHRKVLIADDGESYIGLVTSANPHDGSSAHRNSAIRFSGSAVADLITTENAVLSFSGGTPVRVVAPIKPPTIADASVPTVQVLTEKKIKDALLSKLGASGPEHTIDLMMFYLSDREIVAALKRAQQRGVHLRLLLDPNKDAFGRKKNGIPNRAVAYELHAAGVPLRWCRSDGEQCHSKSIMLDDGSNACVLIMGSANFTRRNLNDFNLETDVAVAGACDASVFIDARHFFDVTWENTAGRRYSTQYSSYEDRSRWRRGLYRFMEWSGLSTF